MLPVTHPPTHHYELFWILSKGQPHSYASGTNDGATPPLGVHILLWGCFDRVECRKSHRVHTSGRGSRRLQRAHPCSAHVRARGLKEWRGAEEKIMCSSPQDNKTVVSSQRSSSRHRLTLKRKASTLLLVRLATKPLLTLLRNVALLFDLI